MLERKATQAKISETAIACEVTQLKNKGIIPLLDGPHIRAFESTDKVRNGVVKNIIRIDNPKDTKGEKSVVKFNTKKMNQLARSKSTTSIPLSGAKIVVSATDALEHDYSVAQALLQKKGGKGLTDEEVNTTLELTNECEGLRTSTFGTPLTPAEQAALEAQKDPIRLLKFKPKKSP